MRTERAVCIAESLQVDYGEVRVSSGLEQPARVAYPVQSGLQKSAPSPGTQGCFKDRLEQTFCKGLYVYIFVYFRRFY